MSQHQRAQRRGRTVAIGVAAALALGGGGYAAFTASANADDNVTAASIECPRVNELLGSVPDQAKAEVDRDLVQVDALTSDANARLTASHGQGGPNFVQNAILGPLREQRVAMFDRIGTIMERTGGQRPQGLNDLAACSLKNGGGSGSSDPGQSQDNGNGGNQDQSQDQGQGQGQDQDQGQDQGQGQGQDQDQDQGQQNNSGDTQSGSAGISPEGFANGLSAADFVSIKSVRPNAKDPNLRRSPSRGTFTSRCGVSDHNNPANFIVAPGVENGAHHVHDYVGNKTSDGFSTNDSLVAAGTSCAKNDKSAYYWPVLRVTQAGDQGDANELGGAGDKNIGTKLRASSVRLEFRGNARSKVAAMPQFLRIITGDAKAAVTNGPANAKAQWSCSNALNRRLTDKYPLCGNSQTVRILDFPSCWDGQNTDSANHRTHVVFPAADGSCQNGFKAIPQLRMTISYRVPAGSKFALDSFPEELHKPVTDHGDFVNVMPSNLMNQVVSCINSGRRC
ncbi:DUF1996 domain-containing protein [Peterkaempfera bronchialis]|uniref:DUF1996 domain-containing protein n=1 Tax=Peterkaempfera bronchialis TaxID=2126346 RepID=A0A345SX54_9ACTN|nr:DUF1996 domain-containing protein [Peterkaempfera bronchialis]AXI78309.1 DUF1996 domain-containing protein [Peterkaempfera bronchialis]